MSQSGTGFKVYFSYAFTGYRTCFVTGHLKTHQVVCMPEALHLRHPVNAYCLAVSNNSHLNRVNGYYFSRSAGFAGATICLIHYPG
jgi:hypothetical protein